MDLDTVDAYLNTYGGRDKFLKALCYSLKFATCLTKNQSHIDKFKLLSSELSNCRLILRFLDYIPVINDIRTNGLGLDEPDPYLRSVNIGIAIINPIFYPFEQIAWAADRKLVKVNSEFWDTVSTVCWVVSLYLELLKCLRKLNVLQQYRSNIRVVDDNTRMAMKKLNEQQRSLLFLTAKTACDFTYAIHYLPEGFLWSGKLKTWQVGVLGTVSALISISQALSKMSK